MDKLIYLNKIEQRRINMELKAIESATAVIGNVHLVYPKDEADKVIAELNDKLKAQTSIAEEAWKEEGIYHTSYAEAVKELYEKNKELRHEKHKRCLANAEACKHKRWRNDDEGFDFARSNRQMLKWLELAEKFKEGV